MLNRSIAPESQQIDNIKFIAPVRHLMDNGIPVFIVNAGQQELVRIEFIFENVNWDANKPLQALAVSHLINNGTSWLSAKDIADKIDYYGAFLQTDYIADQAVVKLYTLNKHLKSVLPILFAIINESIFPDQELGIFVQNQKQSLEVSREKNDFLARKQFSNLLFENTSYGADITESDYDQLNRQDLIEYYNSAYKPENCTVVVAGKFGAGEFDMLNSFMGRKWNNYKKSSPNAFHFHTSKPADIYIEKSDSIQSAIRMGRIAISRSHHDFPGLQVLNCVLGGYFGSRLMSNIREDKGYTYGIGSGVASLKHAGYFFISTEVGVDVCLNTLNEIENELQLLKTELIEEEELQLVRNYMMGSLLGSLDNAFSHADKFKNIYFSGLDHAYYEYYIRTVKDIDSVELRSLAKKYLDVENFTKVVVGKK